MDHSARCRGTVEPVQSAALLLLQTSFPLGGTTALSSLLFYVFTGPFLEVQPVIARKWCSAMYHLHSPDAPASSPRPAIPASSADDLRSEYGRLVGDRGSWDTRVLSRLASTLADDKTLSSLITIAIASCYQYLDIKLAYLPNGHMPATQH